LDNKAYVGDGPDVVQQVRERLGNGWRVTLCAVDGSMTVDVDKRVAMLPPDATHLVLSVGGNDGIDASNVFMESAANMAAAINRLAETREIFARNYEEMLRYVLSKHLPTVLCTVYYPRFPDADFQRLSVAALSLFNDVIIAAAIHNSLPLLDLRLICSEAADYANEIDAAPR
jgi:lysophospholipase L1-like esterase